MGRNILLADDEAYVTSILAHKLQQLGDQVTVASDGQECWSWFVAIAPGWWFLIFRCPCSADTRWR